MFINHTPAHDAILMLQYVKITQAILHNVHKSTETSLKDSVLWFLGCFLLSRGTERSKLGLRHDAMRSKHQALMTGFLSGCFFGHPSVHKLLVAVAVDMISMNVRRGLYSVLRVVYRSLWDVALVVVFARDGGRL